MRLTQENDGTFSAPHTRRRVGTVRIISAIAAICLPLHGASAADRIVGRASVIDGDTLKIAGYRIGLYGIDAPDGAQFCLKGGRKWLCGQSAALALDDKIAHGNVSCDPKRWDRYGRILAVCRLHGEELNAWMVAQGWALAYRLHSAEYVRYERAASGGRRGIWVGEFTLPWKWRQRDGRRIIAPRREGRPSPPNKVGPPVRLTPPITRAQQTAQACIVRAAVGDRTRKGRFCSEAESRAADRPSSKR